MVARVEDGQEEYEVIKVRKPEQIHQTKGEVNGGSFGMRVHFVFDSYLDPEYVHFGTLRVLNDETLSPGTVWPLHPHREIEMVTYCVAGEFRHADETGANGILREGWAQHITAGKGLFHSEINNLPDKPMRFVQMWFYPNTRGLEPSVEQKPFEREQRTNRLLPLASDEHPDALPIRAAAQVYASCLEAGHTLEYALAAGHGVYLYLLEGGPLRVNDRELLALGAVQVVDEPRLQITAQADAELLLIDVLMVETPPSQ